MRVVYPKASVQCLVTEVVKNSFAIWCDGVVFEFHNLSRGSDSTTVQCAARGISAAEGLHEPVSGKIHYDFDPNASYRAGMSSHLVFHYGSGDERSIIAWEIAYDNLRLSFDNYMLAAVLRR